MIHIRGFTTAAASFTRRGLTDAVRGQALLSLRRAGPGPGACRGAPKRWAAPPACALSNAGPPSPPPGLSPACCGRPLCHQSHRCRSEVPRLGDGSAIGVRTYSRAAGADSLGGRPLHALSSIASSGRAVTAFFPIKGADKHPSVICSTKNPDRVSRLSSRRRFR